jgi:hypothetical protein
VMHRAGGSECAAVYVLHHHLHSVDVQSSAAALDDCQHCSNGSKKGTCHFHAGLIKIVMPAGLQRAEPTDTPSGGSTSLGFRA